MGGGGVNGATFYSGWLADRLILISFHHIDGHNGDKTETPSQVTIPHTLQNTPKGISPLRLLGQV